MFRSWLVLCVAGIAIHHHRTQPGHPAIAREAARDLFDETLVALAAKLACRLIERRLVRCERQLMLDEQVARRLARNGGVPRLGTVVMDSNASNGKDKP